jgi:hypothetical protein
MFKNIAIFEKESEVNKGELWQQFELITYLAKMGEITLNELETYAGKLFIELEKGA